MARDSCNLDKDEAEILKRSSSPPPPTSSSSSSSSPAPSSLFPKPTIPRPEAPATDGRDRPTYPSPRRVEEYQPSVRLGNRCSSCRKRVGLTGFRCRCGDLFCARHRYSDVHHCPYDYKAAAREEISKANPLIRAPKIIRI